MSVDGGLRARLIGDSAYELVKQGVIDLGWQDADRRHLPVSFRPAPVRFDEEVPFNTIAVQQTDLRAVDAEMGSLSTDDIWTFYVDVYAEKESIGKHLIHDIRDILRGRMPSIGRTRPVLPVMDFASATPELLFYCDIEDVVVDRATDFPRPWQRYLYVCRFTVVDNNYEDIDG